MNIYYDPEAFGLSVVGSIDFGYDYEFDKIVVWRDVETGDFCYAEDSGCSCPTPFESFGRYDLDPIHRPQDLIDVFDSVYRKGAFEAEIGELIMDFGEEWKRYH